MSDSFARAYAELKDFIANHPEIEIRESVTSIPENVRPDFYSRFNSAREAFVEEQFPEFLSRAGRLREGYAEAIKAAAGYFTLEDSPAVNRLRLFLRDPKDSLTRELFDLLFDLLKNRETPESFDTKASTRIRELFPVLYRGAYEKWVLLSLATLLDVEKTLGIPVRELQPGDRSKSSTFALFEEAPSPAASTRLFFSQPLKAVFAVPDLIIQSARLKRYVGFRSEFREGICYAANVSGERDWFPADADLFRLLANGLSLIYVSDRPEAISLVADVEKFCRPDMLLWCVDTQAIRRNEALETMAKAEARLQPAKGSFIIASDPWVTAEHEAPVSAPEEVNGAIPSEIPILSAGLDRSKLIPVIEALQDTENGAKTA